eukprot:TRINITY_DN13513_c0_g1_i1.p1 TRINITY_DN13513_c0_g1~~TRINITY_DN13513_c0_g1_i1.p1  ORF type:complete len:172 (-),score=67.28 TRINITY_DN13513_c0_g1_i1:23-538(-)
MGRNRDPNNKRFPKKTAQHFHLVFRETNDSSGTSERVLALDGEIKKKQPVKTDNKDFEKEFNAEFGEDDDYEDYLDEEDEGIFDDAEEEGSSSRKKEVDFQWEVGEYGFPDDGYDYTQHFRPIGGGVYVSNELIPTLMAKHPSKEKRKERTAITFREEAKIKEEKEKELLP